MLKRGGTSSSMRKDEVVLVLSIMVDDNDLINYLRVRVRSANSRFHSPLIAKASLGIFPLLIYVGTSLIRKDYCYQDSNSLTVYYCSQHGGREVFEKVEGDGPCIEVPAG